MFRGLCMKVNIEITDTFSGEANYSWVNRASFDMPDNASTRQILKRVRDHFGISCRLYKVLDTFDLLRYNFQGQCVCMFITVE